MTRSTRSSGSTAADGNSRTVVITGASSGIGAALAREYDRRGARVALLARRKERLEALAGSLRDARAFSCDVCDDASVTQAFDGVLGAFGGMDVVVANAGVGINGLVAALSLDDFRRQMETNVFGVVRTAKAALEPLRASRGSLGIIGSVSGYLALPATAPYSMSKFAARAFAESLAAELAPDGVSVTHVAPGFVESEIRMVDNAGALHAEKKDPIPSFLVMSAEQAAREIADAIDSREPEVVLTRTGRAAAWLTRRFPGGVRQATKLLARRIVREVSDIGKG